MAKLGSSRRSSRFHLAAAAVLAACAVGLSPGGIATAQQADSSATAGPGDARRSSSRRQSDSDVLSHVRINIVSRDQLKAVTASGAIPASCRVGMGSGQWYVTPAQRTELARKRIGMEIIDADIAPIIEAERQRIEQHRAELRAGLRGVSWFDDFKDLDEVNQFMDDLIANYPGIVTGFNVGQSVEGRDIDGIRIAGPGGGTRPALLLASCQHAREWITPMVTMFIADQLAMNYGVDPDITALLDDAEVHIVPVVNPDGYEYSWTTSRQWRKNRRNNGDGTFGVDLNRNWPVDFGGESASNITASSTYHGPSALSEPESAALANWINNNPQVSAVIDFHSYAQEILQPWGYVQPWNESPPEYEVIDALGARMRRAVGAVHGVDYPNASGSGGVGLASGIFPDWTTDVRAPGITVEVRPDSLAAGGFAPPPEIIIPTGEENLAAVLEIADFTGTLPVVFADGAAPTTLAPNNVNGVEFSMLPRGGQVLFGATAQLFTRTAGRGDWDAAPLVSLGGSNFRADISAGDCGEIVEWYIQVATTDAHFYRVPRGAPDAPYATPVVDPQIDDDLEDPTGWITVDNATDGEWEHGVPVNDKASAADPHFDADGSGSCWVTENQEGVNSDVDAGSVMLTSPSYDLSGADDWTIAYSYYLYLSDESEDDRLVVSINPGALRGFWQVIAVHDTTGANEWRRVVFSPEDLAVMGIEPSNDVRLRFEVFDDGAATIVEAGVDAIQMYACEGGGETLDGDANDDGVVNVTDLLIVINNWGSAGPDGDVNNDNIVNVSDLLMVINNWGAML